MKRMMIVCLLLAGAVLTGCQQPMTPEERDAWQQRLEKVQVAVEKADETIVTLEAEQDKLYNWITEQEAAGKDMTTARSVLDKVLAQIDKWETEREALVEASEGIDEVLNEDGTIDWTQVGIVGGTAAQGILQGVGGPWGIAASGVLGAILAGLGVKRSKDKQITERDTLAQHLRTEAWNADTTAKEIGRALSVAVQSVDKAGLNAEQKAVLAKVQAMDPQSRRLIHTALGKNSEFKQYIAGPVLNN